jgi:hypothetical protein
MNTLVPLDWVGEVLEEEPDPANFRFITPQEDPVTELTHLVEQIKLQYKHLLDHTNHEHNLEIKRLRAEYQQRLGEVLDMVTKLLVKLMEGDDYIHWPVSQREPRLKKFLEEVESKLKI